MFRILIVDDIEETQKQLKLLLSETFLDSKIDTAGTVRESRELIETAFKRYFSYDAVVLDFRLPKEDIGENPEPDESLCALIRETMPETLVVHITAYPTDENILKHMYEIHHDHRWDTQGELISKLEADWATTLVNRMKAYLYGTRIEAQIEALFGSSGQHAIQPRRQTMYSRRQQGRSLTHALAALSRDIIAHWYDLDEPLKKRIQSIFNVDTESDPIRLSLL